MKRSKTSLVLFVILALLILIQFVPVNRDNPPVTGEFDEQTELQQVFQQSCYDCHSNKTHWPWYGYVAPVSWLVADDVHEGRGHLNFSAWREMSANDQAHVRGEVWKEVEEGEMPLAIYLAMHSDAKLSDDDKALIYQWSKGPATEMDAVDSVQVEDATVEHDHDQDH